MCGIFAHLFVFRSRPPWLWSSGMNAKCDYMMSCVGARDKFELTPNKRSVFKWIRVES